MATRSPRVQRLLDLWAAHRELSALEWLEFRQTTLAAVRWLMCAALGGLVAWPALNAAVVIAFPEQPLRAALGVVAVGAAFAGWKARRLLRRPFFAVTKREAARDVDAIIKVMT